MKISKLIIMFLILVGSTAYAVPPGHEGESHADDRDGVNDAKAREAARIAAANAAAANARNAYLQRTADAERKLQSQAIQFLVEATKNRQVSNSYLAFSGAQNGDFDVQAVKKFQDEYEYKTKVSLERFNRILNTQKADDFLFQVRSSLQ